MDLLVKIFGEGKDLTVWQISARAIVIYFTGEISIVKKKD